MKKLDSETPAELFKFIEQKNWQSSWRSRATGIVIEMDMDMTYLTQVEVKNREPEKVEKVEYTWLDLLA